MHTSPSHIIIADPFYQGTVILLGSHDIVCPVQLLSDYVAHCDAVHHGQSPLFLTVQGLHPMRRWFDGKFFAVLDRTFGSHSLCAGGATYYASLGLSEDDIQALNFSWPPQARHKNNSDGCCNGKGCSINCSDRTNPNFGMGATYFSQHQFNCCILEGDRR